ncbi:hypothetical protein [Pyrobaculum ferrireducens]|uniref:hypothetical protein n=1 Tax=Pyrobaculum ferrireducens TaxID=1104324 RepID=UPI000AA601DC|nr:hypothetical protein [Pyrobaculum ferrireducens]
MIDISYIVNSMVAQAPLVAVAVLVLYYKIVEVRRDLATLEKRVERIEEEVGRNRIELAEVKSSVAHLSTRLAALESRVASVESGLADVKNALEGVRGELFRVRGELGELKERVRVMGEAVYNFHDAFINFPSGKSLVSNSEAVLLRGLLKQLSPEARSRYYTPEVRKRLLELLDKDIEAYTWEDVNELRKIAEAILNEYFETKREDLLRYYPKLRTYIAIIEGILMRKQLEKLQEKKPTPEG